LSDFIAQDRRRKASEDWSEKDGLRFDSNHSEVEWECEKGAEIREIAVFV